jgi:uncharacterized alpha-E superfamily protein
VGTGRRYDKPRSLEQALADLQDRLDRLPEHHPDRPRLARMIGDLRSEIALRQERRQ